MTRLWWLTECPICNGQGRLIVMRSLTSEELLLVCEECCWAWHDPEAVSDPEAAFFAGTKDVQCREATIDEIVQAGWNTDRLQLLEE